MTINFTSAGSVAQAAAPEAPTVEPSEAKAEVAPPVAEAEKPTSIKLSDLGGALTACEASQPSGWSACITRELEARGYRVEPEAGEPKAAEPDAPAVSDKAEASGAPEPAVP